MSKERLARGLYWERAWTLVDGCTPVSEGCAHCWGARESHARAGRQNEKIRARYAGLTDGQGAWTGCVRFQEQNLDLPLRIRKPTNFAIWNDLFHEDIPDESIARTWWVMGQCAGLIPERYRGHTFMVLTKRESRMQEWFKGWTDPATRKRWIEALGEVYDWMDGPKYWPDALPNVLIGVTVENQEMADQRIPILLQIPAAVRFISVEPMLGPVDLAEAGRGWLFVTDLPDGRRTHLDWVICGGESGPEARPMPPEWPRGLLNQCRAAGVPFFFKQFGEWAPVGDASRHEYRDVPVGDGTYHRMFRVGKHAAGRLLAGREWSEIPDWR